MMAKCMTSITSNAKQFFCERNQQIVSVLKKRRRIVLLNLKIAIYDKSIEMQSKEEKSLKNVFAWIA